MVNVIRAILFLWMVIMAIGVAYVAAADKEDDELKLLNAIIQVESGGKRNAVGDGGKALGVLQIWPIMVKDVNRIQAINKRSKRYTLKDRLSPARSVEMFYIWREHYHKKSSDEKIARCWNGGPTGHRKQSTLKYWQKVRKAMKWKNTPINN